MPRVTHQTKNIKELENHFPNLVVRPLKPMYASASIN